MTRLAEEMNVKRIYVSKALNELQSEGLIQLERGRIYIPALENLINAKENITTDKYKLKTFIIKAIKHFFLLTLQLKVTI